MLESMDPAQLQAMAPQLGGMDPEQVKMAGKMMAGMDPVAIALGAVIAESLTNTAGRALAVQIGPLECAAELMGMHPLLSGYLGRGK